MEKTANQGEGWPATETKPAGENQISREEARQIALADVNLPAKAVTYQKTEQKKDKGRDIYEVEFSSSSHE